MLPTAAPTVTAAPRQQPDSQPLPLSVRGLRKSLGGRQILAGVDLDVPAGQLAAVLGANGSGKSTTLRCVVGLLPPDAGSVKVCGQEVTGLSRSELRPHRRRAAMIFQQGHLVRRRSALDNVCAGALGRLPQSRSLSPWTFPQSLREEAMRCLEHVGLADRAGDRVARLSGGQQQRVAIARGLCQRPDVLLADEPVAALDPAAAEHVLALLAELAHTRRLAVVAVLHQPELALRYADRVIGLLDGQVQLDAAGAALTATDLEVLYAAAPPSARAGDER